MKFLKPIITSFLTTATAVCSLTAISSYAAVPVNVDPNIYIDIAIEATGAIRADVIMENVPEFNNAALRFDLGTNWEALTLPDGTVDFVCYGNTITHAMSDAVYKPTTNGNYLTITSAKYQDYNFNGTFVSFYIKKSDTFNWSSASINFVRNPVNYSITDSKGNEYFNSILEIAPIMVGTGEYIVGDVNNSLFVDGIDATLILQFVQLNDNPVSISNINDYFNEIIPDLRSAYAADVNKDGYIDETDAQLTLRYYTEIISGSEYSGYIGTADIYEIYND